MRLRLATVDDSVEISRIHMGARREAMPYLPVLHTDDETIQWIRDMVIPNQTVWVAIGDDGIVGYVAVSGTELNDLYVRPGAQGKGVGSALLDKAKELSPGRLSLWTFQRNANARTFYERRGFRAVEMTDGADNEEREPDVRYVWGREVVEGR